MQLLQLLHPCTPLPQVELVHLTEPRREMVSPESVTVSPGEAVYTAQVGSRVPQPPSFPSPFSSSFSSSLSFSSPLSSSFSSLSPSRQPILTPIERLRRKDREVAAALEEKQRLIEEILNVPHQVAGVSIPMVGMVLHGKVCYCMVGYGTVWYSLVGYSMVAYGMLWYSMAI